MGLLSPLLEIQDIDRTCDQLLIRRRELPERAQKAKVEARIATIDAAHGELVRKREGLDQAEHDMADHVGAVAARAKGVEDTLYGGTVTAAKDLTVLQGEIGVIRAEQSQLEEQEMALLEEMEQAESEIAENRRARAEIEGELAEVDSQLKAAEGVIDGEIAELGRGKASHAEGLPDEVIAAYESLRRHERLNGIAAAALTEKGCGGCKMSLPRLEVARMREKPEEALLHCENCGRLLVR